MTTADKLREKADRERERATVGRERWQGTVGSFLADARAERDDHHADALDLLADTLEYAKQQQCKTNRYVPPYGTDIDVEYRHADDCPKCALIQRIEAYADGRTA